VRRRPATASVVHVPQEPDVRDGETLAGYLSRRTGVAAASAELDAATSALAGGTPGAAGPAERYAAALEAWLAVGAADFAERAEAVADRLGLGVELPARAPGSCPAARRRGCGWPRCCSPAPTCCCWTSPPTTSTCRGWPRWRSWSARSAARSWWSRTTASSALGCDAGGGDRRVQPPDRGVRRRLGRVPGRAGRRAGARRAGIRRVRGGAGRAGGAGTPDEDWARSGARRAGNPGKEPDKHIRFREVQRAQRTGAKAAALERAADRLEAVEEPRDPWQLRLTFRPAGRGSEIVFGLRGAVISRGEVRLGPVDLTITAGERVRVCGPNGSGKSTLLAALLGRSRWRPASGTPAPAWRSARCSRPATR